MGCGLLHELHRFQGSCLAALRCSYAVPTTKHCGGRALCEIHRLARAQVGGGTRGSCLRWSAAQARWRGPAAALAPRAPRPQAGRAPRQGDTSRISSSESFCVETKHQCSQRPAGTKSSKLAPSALRPLAHGRPDPPDTGPRPGPPIARHPIFVTESLARSGSVRA